MDFTLKDYQADAVADILTRLRKARSYWHTEGDRTAFSLTAATGAGKTVIAAAAFEALFYGDDDNDFDADPGAVVLWFSDDPSLNEQTRFRLLEAADRLDSDMLVVPNTFNQRKFEPGLIYFLNTQKLGKNSLLVKCDDDGTIAEPLYEMRPDCRSYTIWDTIQNTIEDPALTLYLVLDEAHRGLGTPSKAKLDEKGTILSRLINGRGNVPAIPVVWGISATVEKFNAAMKGAEARLTLPNVEVDASKVQASGLVKDTIVLDVPDEAGAFDTVLVRRGTVKLKESTQAWIAYADEQDEPGVVVPLMVLQVPNTPDPKEIAKDLATIFSEWPELSLDAVAHVLGEHTTQQFGQFAVPYISPERVQESSWVRVLIAKDAISTGWDCPRAEVMVSFRPAVDRVHITQLLGRMVRTPLARRIPGNDRLNSVECLLPFFDVTTVAAVADMLMHGQDGKDEIPGRRVLVDPGEMVPNPSVPETVWKSFLLLPSQSLPRRGAKPVKRLAALAQELASDGLLKGAGKMAHGELHKVLDAAQARYCDEVQAACEAVYAVEGRTLVAQLQRKSTSFSRFVEESDAEVIEDAYRRAARVISADLARRYADHLAASHGSTDEALLDAHAEIAALGLVPEVKKYLEDEAESLANKWLFDYRVSIRALSDDRQEAYTQIKEMSVEPQDIDLMQPTSRMEATKARDANGVETQLPVHKHHLLADAAGRFPTDFNDWETSVLNREMDRDGFVAWYRNPSRSSKDSLAVVYRDVTGYKAMRPDFLFFAKQANGTIGVDIVDPHGHHFGDALPKLRGLAAYAETHGKSYRRIEAVSKVDEKLRVLNLTLASVRKAVAEMSSAKALYESSHAVDY